MHEAVLVSKPVTSRSAHIASGETRYVCSAGRYWDKFGGCMAGAWAAGTLAGSITYQQPAFELSASYTKGVPDGPCAFTTAAFRKLQLKCSEAAASHIRAADGPVLTQRGEYRIPAGSAADPQVRAPCHMSSTLTLLCAQCACVRYALACMQLLLALSARACSARSRRKEPAKAIASK